MLSEASLEKIAGLLECQIALDLYSRGASQNTIARILKKSKSWVNNLLEGVPKVIKG
jgi:hypothetical protein